MTNRMTRQQVEEIVSTARAKNERPGLRDLDLSGMDLSGIDLCNVDLRGSSMSEANLHGADLSYANVQHASLRYANMATANMRSAILDGTDAAYTNLSDTVLCYATMYGTDLTYADLSRAYMLGAHVHGARPTTHPPHRTSARPEQDARRTYQRAHRLPLRHRHEGNQMNPDEARNILNGTTPGPWFFDYDMNDRIYNIGPIVPYDNEIDCTTEDATLAAYAPDMATMIAGMRPEYAVSLSDGTPVGSGWGTYETAQEDMDAWRKDRYDAHIVRRYVTEQEKVK